MDRCTHLLSRVELVAIFTLHDMNWLSSLHDMLGIGCYFHDLVQNGCHFCITWYKFVAIFTLLYESIAIFQSNWTRTSHQDVSEIYRTRGEPTPAGDRPVCSLHGWYDSQRFYISKYHWLMSFPHQYTCMQRVQRVHAARACGACGSVSKNQPENDKDHITYCHLYYFFHYYCSRYHHCCSFYNCIIESIMLLFCLLWISYVMCKTMDEYAIAPAECSWFVALSKTTRRRQTIMIAHVS